MGNQNHDVCVTRITTTRILEQVLQCRVLLLLIAFKLTNAAVLPEVTTKDPLCVCQREAILGKTILKTQKRKDHIRTATMCNSVPEGCQWGLVFNGSFMLDTFQNKTTNVPRIRPAGQHQQERIQQILDRRDKLRYALITHCDETQKWIKNNVCKATEVY